MLTTLYGEGYANLDYANDQETWDYRELQYSTNYGLTVTVIGFYQGYIDSSTRWMMMDVFLTDDDASAVFNALSDDGSITIYIVLYGNVVLQTASEETANLFV